MNSDATGSQGPECPICYNPFDEARTPKVLGTCGHSFCGECINGCVRDGEATCPTCQQSSPVPPNGFPTNYGFTGMLETARRSVARSHCIVCDEATPDAELFVCTACEIDLGRATFICSLCAMRKHKNHREAIVDLKEVAKPQAVGRARADIEHTGKEIRAQIAAARGTLQDLSGGFAAVHEHCERRYGEMLATLDAGVHVTTATLQTAIDDSSELHDELGAVLADVSDKLKGCQSTLRGALRNYAEAHGADLDESSAPSDPESDVDDAPSGSKKRRA